MNAEIPNFNKEEILNWESVKDRIRPRLLNTEANSNYLSEKPHMQLEDLSVCYAIRISETAEGISEACITYPMMKGLGVNVAKLHYFAMENLYKEKLLVAHISAPNDWLDLDKLDIYDYSIPVFVITNESRFYGAAEILNTAVMDQIADIMGDFYIIPSSVNEVLVMPEKDSPELKDLSRILSFVNAKSPNDDRLSDHIYKYISAEQEIRIVK